MSGSVLIWQEANLYAGDNGPNNSKHLTLTNIKIVAAKEVTHTHSPGGGAGQIKLGMGILEAPEVSFKLIGVDPQTMGLFRFGESGLQYYTLYGVIRDKLTGAAIERKLVLRGRITSIEESEFTRERPTEQDHMISEIMSFSLTHDRQEIWGYEFSPPRWRVNGVDTRSAENAILRI
jgi:hypothetical protein